MPPQPPASDAPPPEPAPAPAPGARPGWDQVRPLFERVAALAPAEREAALAAPGLDAALVAEVRSLLAFAPGDATSAFLAQPARAPAPAEPDRRGQRLGPWEMVERLGSGGMGEVWRARRADGAWQGEAAVKLLKRGMDSDAVLARFAQEQQTLARLNHPHIAHLLDAGRSADGLPFFVLELVQGRPIDAACAGRSLAQRLGLFLQLADAVSHAHRHLLVHRDLKPGNVLVDADCQVKLLDFGIAKALENDAADLTQAGQRPFTPQFASPEQVRGEPVSTATDVYSLGVLLCLMLSGQRPYGRGVSDAMQAARAVLEEAPARASQLAQGRDDAVAPARLRGDLDNIVAKALEKTAERRYASVEALAADLRAFLAGRPVSARRQSAAYLARRFVARNRLATAAAALGLAGLVAGLGLALWQVRQTEAAHVLAEKRLTQARQLANGLVFRYHDQIVNLPGSIPVREALLQEASRHLDGLLAEGEPDPGLARELAETYHRIAILQGEQFSPSQERLVDAARNLDQALALQARYIDLPDTPLPALQAAADMWLGRATLYARAAALGPSRDALQRARSLIERALARAPQELQTVSRLATLEGRIALSLGASASNANLGRVDEAVTLLRSAERRMAWLAEREPGNPEWPHQWAWACQLLARALSLQGGNEEALVWGEKAVQLRDQALAGMPDSSHFLHQTGTVRMTLAVLLSTSGQHERAAQLSQASGDIVRRVVKADPGNKAAQRDVGVLPFVNGFLDVNAGRLVQARQRLDEVLRELPDAGDDFYVNRIRASALTSQARAWLPDDPARALALAQRAADLMRPAPSDDNAARWWTYAQAVGEAAQALARQGQDEAARDQAREALRAWRRSVPDGLKPPASFKVWMDRDRLLAGPAST